jgi:hypothetical protein
MSPLRAYSMNDNRPTTPREVGNRHAPLRSAALKQKVERESPSNPFQRRLAICLAQTVFNAIIVARYAGTLYGATNYDPLQQVGVTLLFAALLGSLARMRFLTLKSRTVEPQSIHEPQLNAIQLGKDVRVQDVQLAGLRRQLSRANCRRLSGTREAIATRWVQTAKGVLLLQMVPDNSESGVIYVFDRQREQWYMLSFEGCEDQFTTEKFDRAFSEYDLFRLVEQPGLLLTEFQPANA